MEDRELLEWAAKAAGHTLGDEVNQYSAWEGGGLLRRNCNGTSTIWNALTDDGDALRLAVKLGITISINTKKRNQTSVWSYGVPQHHERHFDDPCAATRRAITRAAAEIGKQAGKGM